MRTTRNDLIFYPDLLTDSKGGFEFCSGEGVPIPAGVSVKVLDARNGRVLLRYAKRRGFTGHTWANPNDLVPEGEKYVKPKVTRKPHPYEEPPVVSRPHVRRPRLSIKVK